MQTPVIAHSHRCARTVLVTGLTAFAIAGATATAAQKPLEIPWWYQIQAPDASTHAALTQNARGAEASSLDSHLPPMTLDAWLWSTIAPLADHVGPQIAQWHLAMCLDRDSPIPRPGAEMCAEGVVAISPEKNVRMVIVVAGAARDHITGRLFWQPTPPSMRDVYIERVDGSRRIDSLDVPALGMLPQMLATPFERWPAADFESAISWEPRNPEPGETVKFRLSVKNTSKRSVDRVRISILIGACCEQTEARHEWFPSISAGQSVRVEVAVPLPQGTALATISARPWQGDKPVREANPDKLPVYASIGSPARPH